MDNFDFPSILDHGPGPEATPELLGRIVARQRQRRARRYRVVATTTMVVALAGAGLGIRLDQHARTESALGNEPGTTVAPSSLQPPAGLEWQLANGGTGAQSAGVSAPGRFGFSTYSADASAASSSDANSGLVFGAEAPAVGTVNGANAPAPCAAKGCDVVFKWDQPHVLFSRHVQGLAITVSLVTYDYPEAVGSSGTGVGSTGSGVGSTGTGVVAPTPPETTTSPPATSNPNGTPIPVSSPTTGSPPTPVGVPVPNAVSRAVIPVTLVCPVASELVVVVSYGSVTRTLFVPTGGAGHHAFSLVASAGASLGSAGSVVLAVAHTSPSVNEVSAAFPGAGTDAMTPRDGWSVLAQRLRPGTNLSRGGFVEMKAMSASGKVLESAQLPRTGLLASAPVVAVCRILLVPVNAVKVASGPPVGAPGASPGGSGSSGGAPTQPSS